MLRREDKGDEEQQRLRDHDNAAGGAVEIVAEPGAEETGQAADSHGDSQQAREAIG
ncbi:Uncharacterised protein [Klebsiella pneumoniae]|nr:Uncharacterised protein [Klebsiella pneumoniae]